jgi:hypothetical protein
MFMTHKQALEILQREDEGKQSYAECLAEAGMGAVSFGWSGYDGMTEYSVRAEERRQDWEADNPEEAARHYEELATATAVAADFSPLPLYAADELSFLAYLPRVPEYRLNYRKPFDDHLDLPF